MELINSCSIILVLIDIRLNHGIYRSDCHYGMGKCFIKARWWTASNDWFKESIQYCIREGSWLLQWWGNSKDAPIRPPVDGLNVVMCGFEDQQNSVKLAAWVQVTALYKLCILSTWQKTAYLPCSVKNMAPRNTVASSANDFESHLSSMAILKAVHP